MSAMVIDGSKSGSGGSGGTLNESRTLSSEALALKLAEPEKTETEKALAEAKSKWKVIDAKTSGFGRLPHLMTNILAMNAFYHPRKNGPAIVFTTTHRTFVSNAESTKVTEARKSTVIADADEFAKVIDGLLVETKDFQPVDRVRIRRDLDECFGKSGLRLGAAAMISLKLKTFSILKPADFISAIETLSVELNHLPEIHRQRVRRELFEYAERIALDELLKQLKPAYLFSEMKSFTDDVEKLMGQVSGLPENARIRVRHQLECHAPTKPTELRVGSAGDHALHISGTDEETARRIAKAHANGGKHDTEQTKSEARASAKRMVDGMSKSADITTLAATGYRPVSFSNIRPAKKANKESAAEINQATPIDAPITR